MGLINWIFDIYQQVRIEKLNEQAEQARFDALELRSRAGQPDLARLERAIGELALATKTLQRILVEKNLVSPQDFATKLVEVDREDGVEDRRAPT